MKSKGKRPSYECDNYNHVDCKGELAQSCSCWCHRTTSNPRYANLIPSKKARVRRS